MTVDLTLRGAEVLHLRRFMHWCLRERDYVDTGDMLQLFALLRRYLCAAQRRARYHQRRAARAAVAGTLNPS